MLFCRAERLFGVLGVVAGVGAMRRREARQIAAVGRQLVASWQNGTKREGVLGGAGQGDARWSVTYDVALPV